MNIFGSAVGTIAIIWRLLCVGLCLHSAAQALVVEERDEQALLQRDVRVALAELTPASRGMTEKAHGNAATLNAVTTLVNSTRGSALLGTARHMPGSLSKFPQQLRRTGSPMIEGSDLVDLNQSSRVMKAYLDILASWPPIVGLGRRKQLPGEDVIGDIWRNRQGQDPLRWDAATEQTSIIEIAMVVIEAVQSEEFVHGLEEALLQITRAINTQTKEIVRVVDSDMSACRNETTRHGVIQLIAEVFNGVFDSWKELVDQAVGVTRELLQHMPPTLKGSRFSGPLGEFHDFLDVTSFILHEESFKKAKFASGNLSNQHFCWRADDILVTLAEQDVGLDQALEVAKDLPSRIQEIRRFAAATRPDIAARVGKMLEDLVLFNNDTVSNWAFQNRKVAEVIPALRNQLGCTLERLTGVTRPPAKADKRRDVAMGVQGAAGPRWGMSPLVAAAVLLFGPLLRRDLG